MRRGLVVFLGVVSMLTVVSCDHDPSVVHVGAVYPLTGSQGPGGRDEYRGVQMAVDFVDQDGGVNGHPIVLDPVDVAGGDAAPTAIDGLADQGIRFVVGSYGSTISQPAAAEAAR
jgi:branched-chain amino acid transport system substrate-binding protein